MFFRKKKQSESAAPADAEPEEQPAAHPAEPRFKAAMEMLNNERYDEAIPMLEDVMRRYPDFNPSMVLYGLGIAYEGKGWLDHAAGALQKSVQANVQNFEAHIFLGNVYAKLGRNNDAITEYNFVIDNRPDHELVPGLKASVQQLKGFSTKDARTQLIEEVEAFRVLVKRQFKIDLEYNIKGLQILDMIMDSGFNDVRLAGGFIGEVIVRTIGGTWRMMTPIEESFIVAQDGQAVKPFDMAQSKIDQGKNVNLLALYQSVQGQPGT